MGRITFEFEWIRLDWIESGRINLIFKKISDKINLISFKKNLVRLKSDQFICNIFFIFLIDFDWITAHLI
jgi:hypothetical protein